MDAELVLRKLERMTFKKPEFCKQHFFEVVANEINQVSST
jgi:hypothetical protein